MGRLEEYESNTLEFVDNFRLTKMGVLGLPKYRPIPFDPVFGTEWSTGQHRDS